MKMSWEPGFQTQPYTCYDLSVYSVVSSIYSLYLDATYVPPLLLFAMVTGLGLGKEEGVDLRTSFYFF